MMKVVIMAGGKGTRISSLNSEVPKPMIVIAGKPILEQQIEVLKDQGYTDIILAIGYLGDRISSYFGDGEKFGVKISYVKEDKPLGTAGALNLMKDILTEDFLLINGDIIFNIDISRFQKYHYDKGGIATIFTHPNDHPYDSGLIFSKEAIVEKWLHKEDDRLWYKNRVNAGLHMISPKIFNLSVFSQSEKIDLDRDVLKNLIKTRDLLCYDSPEYAKDMGTPERFYEVENDIINGKVNLRNLNNKQKAIFLDRDGTLNKYVGFLRNIDDLELIDGTCEGVKKINRSEYLAIVITNQPVIARGEVKVEELNEIHNKLETLLGNEGAYIDAIYYCPHHPDSGFEGEIKELKVDCYCRKPKPGLLFKAAEEFNIDLNNSWMIGDSESDVKAGKAAGCKCIKIGDKESIKDVLEAVKRIIGN